MTQSFDRHPYLKTPNCEQCPCGERKVEECDEEWGPQCDLGNNPKFAAPAEGEQALDSLFRENEIGMSDRNGQLYDIIRAALAQDN